jgi:MraZ protein
MYIGTYYHTIEAKGRIAVPAKFREELGVNPILTRGLDGCLFLYSQETWKAFITTLEDSTVTKRHIEILSV